jgi:hypothetical protein
MASAASWALGDGGAAGESGRPSVLGLVLVPVLVPVMVVVAVVIISKMTYALVLEVV